MARSGGSRYQSRVAAPMGPHGDPRRRSASKLLNQAGALDRVSDPVVRAAGMERVQAEAARLGLAFQSLEITLEPIPDPVIDALPESDWRRVKDITERMFTEPAGNRAELEELVERYPHIPMLWNHLAGALSASGEHGRAKAVIEKLALRFPDYLFGMCNHVMQLLGEQRVEDARRILETGPRGPLLCITAYCPGRTRFHISEIVAFTAMIGRYLLMTKRVDDARMHLGMLQKLAPDNAQTRKLAESVAYERCLAKMLDAFKPKTGGRKPRKSA